MIEKFIDAMFDNGKFVQWLFLMVLILIFFGILAGIGLGILFLFSLAWGVAGTIGAFAVVIMIIGIIIWFFVEMIN